MNEPTDIMKEITQGLPQIDESLGLPILEFDYERYRKETDKYNIPEEQAKELLSNLFYIIHTLVDIDLGLDITQILNFDEIEKTGQDSGNALLLEQSKASFNEAAHTTIKKED